MSGRGIGFAEFPNCGYSTLLYPSTFSVPGRGYAQGPGVGDGTYGVSLWYEIQRNATVTNCAEAAKDQDKFECSNNARCHDKTGGYICQCQTQGYEGDGYTLGTGCKDINECLKPNNCSSIATCVNTYGSYECKCPDKMEGDGKDPQLVPNVTNCIWIDQCTNNTGLCSPNAECFFDTSSGVVNCKCQGGTSGDGLVNGTGCKETSNLAIIIGVSVGGVVFIIINSILLWCFVRRRQLAFDPAIFSQQELLNEIENKEGAKFCKTFTFNELREATKDFSVELGSGGFGTVFEGTLPDGTKVAVKKAKHGMGETRSEAKQFVNEIVILLQLNHRNLVNLLGCCLETRVPVLVYEFVSNGNLDEHIQMKRATEAQRSTEGEADDTSDLCHPPLNWTLRLKIAIETAEGLSYLHWGTSPPVYHRDVKCANILLDKAYNVKVADFGLSKLVPLEDTAAYAVTTAIQGTPGYMDPGLLDQYELTDKSDVYSYGVLLLVILTGQRPVDLRRQPRDQNLVNRCNRLMTQGLFADIIDPILSEAAESPYTLEAMDAVAKLAMKCVSRDGHDRPTMKEVVSELHTIQRKTETSVSKMVKSLAKKINFSEEYTLVPLADGQWHKSYDISTSISAVGR
ncbi:protein MpRLK-Pelle_WAK1 [Marchantia polymorpha subsp. ruderalis]